MNSLRTEDDYKRAIRELLQQAETSLESDLQARDGDQKAAMSDRDIQHFMRGLDLAITEEATIALRAEFLRYSSAFDVKHAGIAQKFRAQRNGCFFGDRQIEPTHKVLYITV